MSLQLEELITSIDSTHVDGPVDGIVEAIEHDSRQTKAGAVFVAVPGFVVDGFDFADDAVKRGALAVVSERDNECNLDVTWIKTDDCRRALSDLAAKFYEYPGKMLKICGITGTNGKTTSAYLLKAILEERNKKVGLIGSLEYDTCGEKFEADRTTPESLDIQRLLYLMRANHCNNVVMEVSSHALQLGRVENVEFRVGLFTNLTRDHLDFHQDMDAYFEAKALLLSKLDGLMKYAVINLDVPEFRELFGRVSSAYLSFSLQDSSADVHTTERDYSATGTFFNVVTPMGARTVKTPLCGEFNLMNTLGALSAGLASGVDIDTAVRALEKAQPVPGRFQRIDCGQPFSVIVDYAHTPDAISRVIKAAREFTEGKVIALYGCGGDRDNGKRALMGEAASEADVVIVTSDNPRSEDPQTIIDDTLKGVTGEHVVIVDRREAVTEAIRRATENDTALLLGKGAEQYEISASGMNRYSEQREAERALQELGYQPVTS
jgi:UDP-N-acetylmuramoyl-L-alanyl-D-glutamate--2,6-diaminopimelate ligase